MTSGDPTFQERLRQGGLVGTFLMVPSPDLMEIAGLARFDFVVIDLEHGALSFGDVPSLVNAALANGVRPVVRVDAVSSPMIGKALDVGADAVIVPSIASASDAATAVAAAKFAPLGARGACPRVRGARYGEREPAEFYGSENGERGLILLVESASGMDNLEAILATDGIDAMFFGYADLSHSLGHPCEPSNPDVIERVDRAVARVVAAGVTVGVSCRSEAEAARRLRFGVNFVTYSGLETLALRACREVVARVRGVD